MLDKLLNYIKQQKLFQPEEKILLAVSGGIDSMVMVNLFNQAKINFAIAHCNFQLRGKESDWDQKLVEDVAVDSIVPYFWKSFDTEKYAETNGISIQMAARDLRRTWFNELFKSEEYDYIATAHHLNDSLETALFNLTKGTGIAGLKGISSKAGNYIRPLMFATREMIRDYAKENNIKWRDDSSNSSTKYSRNIIRHNIIPELRKINPNIEETFSYSMEKIAASDRIYKKEITKLKSELTINIDDGIKIQKQKLHDSDESIQILFEILKDFGFNYHQARNVVLSLDGQAGKIFYSESYKLVNDRDYLFVSPRLHEKANEILISKSEQKIETDSGFISVEMLDRQEVEITDDDNIALIDFEILEFPLKLRTWQQGDRFQPLGMKHKKKLSDFMIDNKIPLNLKEQVLVLISGNDIVWVVGYRIDDRYKITTQTSIVCKICKSIDK